MEEVKGEENGPEKSEVKEENKITEKNNIAPEKMSKKAIENIEMIEAAQRAVLNQEVLRLSSNEQKSLLPVIIALLFLICMFLMYSQWRLINELAEMRSDLHTLTVHLIS